MNKDKIIRVLEKEGLCEFDEINYKKDFFILDCYYTFDKVELEAAREYANDNYKEETDDKWYDEYYFPYLYDIAADNIEEVIEEISEEDELVGNCTLCEMEIKSKDRCEIIIVFSNNDFDMDEVLESIDE